MSQVRRLVGLARGFAIFVLGIALIAAVLAGVRACSARPRRWLVPVGVGIVVLDLLPAALLLWKAVPPVGAGIFGMLLLEGFALFLCANLMPGPAHPRIAQLEAELALVSPARRRVRLAVRIVLGSLLFVVGGVATVVTGLVGPVMLGFTGAMAGGILIAGTSVAVAVRSLVRREP
jgi:hypothetical protein